MKKPKKILKKVLTAKDKKFICNLMATGAETMHLCKITPTADPTIKDAFEEIVFKWSKILADSQFEEILKKVEGSCTKKN